MIPTRANRVVLAISFIVFAISFAVLDVPVILRGGPVLVMIGIGLMSVSGLEAAMAFLDDRRRRLWAGAVEATLGTGIGLALVGIFSRLDLAVVGYALGGGFGLLFWIACVLSVREWFRARAQGPSLGEGVHP